MVEGRAVTAREGGVISGVLLYSTKHNMISCLAVDEEHSRNGVSYAHVYDRQTRQNRRLNGIDSPRGLTETRCAAAIV